MVPRITLGPQDEVDEGKGIRLSSSSDTPPLPTLPVELQLLVIQLSIPSSPSYSTLQARYDTLGPFCLVSRTWNSFAQPLLDTDVLLPTPARARLFLSSLSSAQIERPQRVGTLRLGKILYLGSTFEEMAELQEAASGDEDDEDKDAEVAEAYGLPELLQRCTGVRELWMTSVKHCLLSQLRYGQSLESLHILRCSLCDCDIDTDELSSPPLIFPRLSRLEVFVRSTTSSALRSFFSSFTFPALKHFAWACHDQDFPSAISTSSLTSLSTVTDLPAGISTSTSLLFLDAYQLPIREALNLLPTSIQIVRLNDFSPLSAAIPFLLVDHAASKALVDRLTNLRELWVPGSFSEWRDDPKPNVREMVRKWVRGWESRGVKVVFEESETDVEPELRRLTEKAAFDFTFSELSSKVERWKLEEQSWED
ncbi:hypothetical protein JCM8547_005197 [Rhodosporidiobolus lusitaniae]